MKTNQILTSFSITSYSIRSDFLVFTSISAITQQNKITNKRKQNNYMLTLQIRLIVSVNQMRSSLANFCV